MERTDRMPGRTDPARGKEGIALVIVLGFLTILIILGVAFVITMRMERLAARNYVHNVKARQSIKVAETRALVAIETDLAGATYPDWGANNTIVSSGGTTVGDLASGLAETYFPKSLQAGVAAEAANAEWVNFSDGTTTIGRYAYLAVNCSGLLDANYIGATPRGGGTSTAEIVFSSLPEFDNDELGYYRSYYKRFESVPELYRLCANDALAGHPLPLRQLPSSYADSLFVYSYYPQGYSEGGVANSNVVYIGGMSVVTSAAVRAAIQAQFGDLGFPNPEMVMWNLIDYLDTDNAPGGGSGLLNNFCTEPVPMINEVFFANRVGVGATATDEYYTNSLDVTVEVWFPFVGVTNPNTYNVELRIRPDAPAGAFGVTIAGSLSAGAAWTTNQPYRYVKFSVTNLTTRAIPGGPAIVLPTRYRMDLSVREGAGGVIVDRITDNPNPPGLVAAVPAIIPGETAQGRDYYVNDPRINWDLDAHWTRLDGDVNTLSNENPGVSASYLAGDGTSQMYVRNRSGLPTVGELGYLLYSATKPWRTIRLVGPDPDNTARVLDRFTVATNSLRKGLANMNSLNTNVLAAAFTGAAAEWWPGEAGVILIASNAQRVAEAVIDAGPYANLSDIARLTEADLAASMPDVVLAPAQMESIIRTTAGLLGTRQNLFTIILAVQSLGDSGEVMAEQRAVEVVWRDPYEDPVTGRHPTFVRFFHWLYE